ncbi:hypothetical protein [Rufibacter quisquiliarum]|uniref:Phage protein D n=1 Tax=Rufibacter quisquiliarum TaxID=1549639 RepID=A0A839GW23_9BACT|nr:hypothetical protein [Rufibacter quisquiliarum]MBA9078936.1 hypothetical protein [Rufibacter quisquiliarum]
MAFILTCEIYIGPYVFRKINKVKIKNTWKELGAEATISLYNLKGKLEQAITAGMPVEVWLGYDGILRKEFSGYVRSISPKIPFEVECEDEVYHLKRKTVNNSWRSISLRNLLEYLMPHAVLSANIPNVILSPFRLNKVTVADALRKLKEEYLMCAYFRDGRLFVGLPYTEFSSQSGVPGGAAIYDFAKNIASEGSLTYRNKEDVRLRAKVVNILKNNTRQQIEVGDPDGELRTLTFRNASANESELRKLAERELEKYKFEGYRGSFTGFGLPYISHSGTIELRDSRYPQRAGRYVVDSVNTTFGVDGFRREIEIGKAV